MKKNQFQPQDTIEIAPAPSKEATLAELRKEAESERQYAIALALNVQIQALVTLLSFEGGPEAEAQFQEAREHLKKYFELRSKIAKLSGKKDEADRVRRERARLTYRPSSGNYSVSVSDITASGETFHPPSPSQQYIPQLPTNVIP